MSHIPLGDRIRFVVNGEFSMPAPNFLLIGPQKSGSTSIHYYLKQHPDIYLPQIKELGFFNERYRRRQAITFEEYCRFFDDVTNETIIAEICPQYLARPESPVLIKQYLPDVKMLAVLRNPVDRIISAYKMQTRNNMVRDSFEVLLQKRLDGSLPPQNESLFNIGFYATHLKRYHGIFPKEQLKVMFYEELQTDVHGFLVKVFDYLGVRSDIKIDTDIRYNSSSYPRSMKMYSLYRTIRDDLGVPRFLREYLPKPMVKIAQKVAERTLLGDHPYKASAETRQKLKEFYRDSILELQDYLQVDLAHWLR
jgi:Sulfotransferase domain